MTYFGDKLFQNGVILQNIWLGEPCPPSLILNPHLSWQIYFFIKMQYLLISITIFFPNWKFCSSNFPITKHSIFAKKNGWALGNLQLGKNLSSSLLAETLLENLFYFHQVRNWAPPFSRMLSINIFRFKLALQSIDIGARLGWTKILTKMASVTMHLWILKCENLNEFF